MIDGKTSEVAAKAAYEATAPRDLVSPLSLAAAELREPIPSDDELDELCNIEIAELSRPRLRTAG